MGESPDPVRPRLIGYRHSVYTRAVRIALAELGVAYEWQEANPFAEPVPGHPFRRVPVLEVDGVRVYETWAILTYLYADYAPVSEGSPLQAARAAQVAGIVNAYAYWPLVRQVYAQEVFRAALGEAGDAEEIAAGHAVAEAVLEQLEEIAAEGLVLRGQQVGPEDCILFVMIDAYAQSSAGATQLALRPHLQHWWQSLAGRDRIADTFTPITRGE